MNPENIENTEEGEGRGRIVVSDSHYASGEAEYLLCIALDIGEGILASGGEVNRVEDTVTRICEAYGAVHTEVFAIPSLIIATVHLESGEHATLIRRLGGTSNNLLRLEMYNDISYKICRTTPPLSEVEETVKAVKRKSRQPSWLSVLGSVLGAGSFAVFFGGTWRDGLVTAFIGAVIALLDLIPSGSVNRFAKIAVQSFVGGMLGYLSVIVGIGENVDMINIGSIMLLIPGLSFGTALRDLLYGDFLAGSLKTVQVVLLALMIAFGYMLAMIVMGGAV